MKYIKFLTAGILFGIMMTKAEIISWYRIYEMFRFESFHMYGVIGSAIVLGIIATLIIKRYKLKDISGQSIELKDKDKAWTKSILGGIIFGFGWAMVGACPGPMFILIGYGYLTILIVIAGAVLGTFAYGTLKNYLPH